MNKAILLCAAGMMALGVTGCNTCCDQPRCPPQGVGYGMEHHAVHHRHHHKTHHHKAHHHKAHHHKAKVECDDMGAMKKPAPPTSK